MVEVLCCYEFFWGSGWYYQEFRLQGVVPSSVSFGWCEFVVCFDIDASLPYVCSILIV